MHQLNNTSPTTQQYVTNIHPAPRSHTCIVTCSPMGHLTTTYQHVTNTLPTCHQHVTVTNTLPTRHQHRNDTSPTPRHLNPSLVHTHGHIYTTSTRMDTLTKRHLHAAAIFFSALAFIILAITPTNLPRFTDTPPIYQWRLVHRHTYTSSTRH